MAIAADYFWNVGHVTNVQHEPSHAEGWNVAFANGSASWVREGYGPDDRYYHPRLGEMQVNYYLNHSQ